jgi:HK97 family phage major capsid protein
MVPTELAKEVMHVAAESGIARKFCRIFPMGTDAKNISSIVAGVTTYRVAQGVAPTGSKPTIGVVDLVAKKLMALVGSANELIEDNMTNEEVFSLVSKLI